MLCEDTRRTRKLLTAHGIRAELLSYHEHNEAARTAQVLPRLETGARIALVSDAGLPAISDPGARLVAAALEAGIAVTVLPGASAVETALVAAGLPFERYQFLGYLPRGGKALEALFRELESWPHAAIAFESPQRLPRSRRRPRGNPPGPRRRRLPRADEGVRGGRARRRTGRGCAVLDRGEGRDHDRDRAGLGRRSGRRAGSGLRPSPSSWTPVSPVARPRTSSRASPAHRGTASIATHSDCLSDLTTDRRASYAWAVL